jgi:hypothetical protein
MKMQKKGGQEAASKESGKKNELVDVLQTRPNFENMDSTRYKSTRYFLCWEGRNERGGPGLLPFQQKRRNENEVPTPQQRRRMRVGP